MQPNELNIKKFMNKCDLKYITDKFIKELELQHITDKIIEECEIQRNIIVMYELQNIEKKF